MFARPSCKSSRALSFLKWLSFRSERRRNTWQQHSAVFFIQVISVYKPRKDDANLEHRVVFTSISEEAADFRWIKSSLNLTSDGNESSDLLLGSGWSWSGSTVQWELELGLEPVMFWASSDTVCGRETYTFVKRGIWNMTTLAELVTWLGSTLCLH